MKPISTFEIVSSGLVKEGKGIENYIALMSGIIRKIGNITETDKRTFAFIGYSLVWVGELVKPEDLDLVYKQFIRYGGEYLNEWILNIKISYRETE